MVFTTAMRGAQPERVIPRRNLYVGTSVPILSPTRFLSPNRQRDFLVAFNATAEEWAEHMIPSALADFGCLWDLR